MSAALPNEGGVLGLHVTVDDAGRAKVVDRMPHVDRSRWPAGPWHAEPDRIEWRTATGLTALMLRAWTGAWCGYVAVPPGHPAHGLREADAYDLLPGGVHGALTYAAACDELVGHVPATGEPGDVWWLGFDTGHWGDLLPDLARHVGCPPGQYRDVAYVRAEVESLAEQLAAVALQRAPTEPPPPPAQWTIEHEGEAAEPLDLEEFIAVNAEDASIQADADAMRRATPGAAFAFAGGAAPRVVLRRTQAA